MTAAADNCKYKSSRAPATVQLLGYIIDYIVGENSTLPTLSRCKYRGHSVTPMNANVIYLGVRRDYLHKSQKNLTP